MISEATSVRELDSNRNLKSDRQELPHPALVKASRSHGSLYSEFRLSMGNEIMCQRPSKPKIKIHSNVSQLHS